MASFKCSIFGILKLILIFIAAADNYTSSEQHLKVKFEVNLDVGTLDPAGYRDFQAKLRDKLAARYIGPEGNNVAVLPPDNEGAPQWFDLKLKGAGKAATVRFRVGNLYVVGYRQTPPDPLPTPPPPEPTWFELGKTGDRQWIPNSQFLGFKGDYGALATAARKAVTDINLNRFNFETAVKTLATSTKGDESVAAALIVVAQLISEACRFVVLSNGLSEKLLSPSVKLKEWMLEDLEKNWKTYSKILLCDDKFPDTYKFPKPTINQIVIATAADLRKKLGILLNVQVDNKVCKITANDVELPGVIAFQAQVQNHVELAGVEA